MTIIFFRCIVLIGAVAGIAGCVTNDSSNLPESDLKPIADPVIDAFVREMVTEERFSGVVLVEQNGETIHAKAYGFAKAGQANSIGTDFHVASVTKQFTAAAVLQLVERDVIELHNSINGYLPERHRSRRWDPVSVHHLLSHSSGIADYAVQRAYYEISDGFASTMTIEGMIAEARSRDLEFAPGSQYRYSNLGYTLLGKIIEYMSGTAFADYMERNIFEPLSMRDSRVRSDPYVAKENDARGFRWDAQRASFVEDDTRTLPATPSDAGIITTIGDFAKWAAIFRDDQRMMSTVSVDAMTAQHIQMEQGGAVDAYGYGLGVGDRLLAHAGHVVGFKSQFIFDKQTNLLVAVFANNSAVNMERVAFGLLTQRLTPPS